MSSKRGTGTNKEPPVRNPLVILMQWGWLTFYPKVEKPSTSSWNNFGKITKKELVMTLKNIELLCVIFFYFKALSCIL